MGGSSSKELELYRGTQNAYEGAIGNIKDAYAKAAEMSKEELKFRAEKIENQDELIKHGIALIERQQGEIRELREQLKLLLYEKSSSKETELEDFIERLKVSYRWVCELKEAYQNLIRARENYNQDEIDAANSKIKQIRDQVLNGQSVGGISIGNFRELCNKCNELVKVEEQLNKICQQKYEARQEARTSQTT